MRRRRFKPIQYAVGSPIYTAETHRDPRRRTFQQINWGSRVPQPLITSYERQYKNLGPIASDTSVSGYTEPWIYWAGGPQSIYGEGPYSDYGNSASQGVGSGDTPHWIWYEPGPYAFDFWSGPHDKKMQPVRFQMNSFDNSYWSSQFFYRNPGISTLQNSSQTPPPTADGHFSGSMLSGVTFPRALVYCTSFATSSQITHARVLVDGVDVSGVIAFAIPITMQAYNAVYTYALNANPIFTVTLPSPVSVSGKSVVEVDLWIRVIVTRVASRVFNTGFTTSYPSGYQDPWIFSSILGVIGSHLTGFQGPFFNKASFGQINVHRTLRGTENWIVTFSGPAVGGVSSLTMQPQTGWTFSRDGANILMTKTTGTGIGDRVQFNYATETPEVRIFKNVSMVNGGGWMRYLTESPSYYGPTGPGGKQFSPITLSTSNTMLPAAKQVAAGGGGITPYWLPIEQAQPSQTSLFPTSITLSK